RVRFRGVAAAPHRLAAGGIARLDLAAERDVAHAAIDDRPRALVRPYRFPVVQIARDVGDCRATVALLLAHDLAGRGRDDDLLLLASLAARDVDVVAIDPGRGGGADRLAPHALAGLAYEPERGAGDRRRVYRVAGDHRRREQLAADPARPHR